LTPQQTRIETAAAELVQAERSLRSSRVLLSDGDASGAVNRLYYALYHAARALLIAEGVEIPKSHAGLIATWENSARTNVHPNPW
jgi:uncharacterized protein (UPF0332 family)